MYSEIQDSKDIESLPQTVKPVTSLCTKTPSPPRHTSERPNWALAPGDPSETHPKVPHGVERKQRSRRGKFVKQLGLSSFNELSISVHKNTVSDDCGTPLSRGSDFAGLPSQRSRLLALKTAGLSADNRSASPVAIVADNGVHDSLLGNHATSSFLPSEVATPSLKSVPKNRTRAAAELDSMEKNQSTCIIYATSPIASVLTPPASPVVIPSTHQKLSLGQHPKATHAPSAIAMHTSQISTRSEEFGKESGPEDVPFLIYQSSPSQYVHSMAEDLHRDYGSILAVNIPGIMESASDSSWPSMSEELYFHANPQAEILLGDRQNHLSTFSRDPVTSSGPKLASDLVNALEMTRISNRLRTAEPICLGENSLDISTSQDALAEFGNAKVNLPCSRAPARSSFQPNTPIYVSSRPGGFVNQTPSRAPPLLYNGDYNPMRSRHPAGCSFSLALQTRYQLPKSTHPDHRRMPRQTSMKPLNEYNHPSMDPRMDNAHPIIGSKTVTVGDPTGVYHTHEHNFRPGPRPPTSHFPLTELTRPDRPMGVVPQEQSEGSPHAVGPTEVKSRFSGEHYLAEDSSSAGRNGCSGLGFVQARLGMGAPIRQDHTRRNPSPDGPPIFSRGRAASSQYQA